MIINKDSLIEGLIIPIFKPLNWTSFDVVKKLRGDFKKTFNLKKIKVGHAGTLDPLATGLLLICTGRKTKIIEDLQNLDKTYFATFDFGKTTPSFDRETGFDKNYPTDHITKELIIKNLKNFQGKIKQKPPYVNTKSTHRATHIRNTAKEHFGHFGHHDRSLERSLKM